MSSVLIFANLTAGRGRARRIAEELAGQFKQRGYTATLLTDRADGIQRGTIDRRAAAAIVIGGDGTLRQVAQRLHERTPIPPLLVVPMGTANLMGKHLGIRWKTAHLADQLQRAIEHGKRVQLDCAKANGELFLLMAGVGLDAKVVHELSRIRSGPISYLSYLRPLMTALAGYDFQALTVTVDGKLVFGPAPAVAFVGNIKEYGTGFPVLSRANPTDGRLDVCVLPCRSTFDLLDHAIRAAVGVHLNAEGVVYTLGKHIEISSPQQVPVQIDGEAAGHTPLSIDLLPMRLPFIVPA